jgi:L-2,4-diaminobutyric acid acetyltransferase
VIRQVTEADAGSLWTLLGRVSGLERNTAYAYLLLCSHFASTSLVAERDGAPVGFVLAYRPPSNPNRVFVWQVGVAPEARGEGIAGRLLDALADAPACQDVDELTATVGPDNTASNALFRAFARRRGTTCSVERGYPAALFPAPHADEDLLRIPLTQGTP